MKIETKPPKRRCFLCDSEKHLKYNCPKNPRNQQWNKGNKEKKVPQEQEQQHQAKHVASTSSGLYVEGKVNNVVMECLVDTGATLSILSLKTWDILRKTCVKKLEKH